MPVRVKIAVTNTGAMTLNAGTPGPLPVRKNLNKTPVAGDFPAGSIHTFVFDGNYWQAQSATGEFPSGTVTDFFQASAPLNWTQVTTHNNKAIRVVSGTGGGGGGASAFTSVFGTGKSSGGYALQANDIPQHTHPAGSLATSVAGAHIHSGGYLIWGFVGGSGPTGGSLAASTVMPSAGDHSHTVTGSTGNNSTTASAHSHSLSLDLQYIDVILASKN